MNKLNKWVIATYISLYIVISFVSTMHSVSFFGMTNDPWMSYALAGAFELGQLAAMAGLMTLEKSNKKLIIGLMVVLTAMQIMANMFFSYAHVTDATAWFELFGLQNTNPIVAKRILAAVSGGLLPLIALGFIKSLVDYLKPEAVVEAPYEPLVEEPINQEWVDAGMPYQKEYGVDSSWKNEIVEGKPNFKEEEPIEFIDEPIFIEPIEEVKHVESVKPVEVKLVHVNGIPSGPQKPTLRSASLPDID